MNILSLFDGISCGRVALERAGIEVDNYYASEIDKHAITVSENNYPDIIRLGDVTKWQEWNIDWASIDLIIAGSPCQGFSFTGKQLAFDDPRSILFFVFVNILNHIKKHNPRVKFLLENVRMKKEFIKVINDCLGVEPILINSALVSAQDRKRLYWANWDAEQPADKGILLKDILLNDSSFIIQRGHGFNKGGVFKEKSPAMTSSSWEHNNYICSKGWHEWWQKNKEHQQKKSYSQIGNTKEKAITLMARMYASWQGNFVEINDSQIRKLTPVECERLQTLPDNFTDGISDAQRYKCLGNGWTVDVIAHLLKPLKEQHIESHIFKRTTANTLEEIRA